MDNETSKRKLDHINSCLKKNVESYNKKTGFGDIELIHQASPEINLENIDLNTKIFGKKLDAPIIICPMTGGHEKGKQINTTLAKAAQNLNIAFSVGSQRAAIEKPELEETYQVRDEAPDILLFGNLGITQLSHNYGLSEAEKAIDMIDADGLGIHFNPLQEAIQPEGHGSFKGAINSLSKISSGLKHPIYVKETGAGMNGENASKFEETGIDAIDISGAGGTSWAGVETTREESRKQLGDVFWDWGIPTAVSTVEVLNNVDIPVISSGGIRTGLEAAKALALGADLVGMGLPLFRASMQGEEKVVEWLEEFTLELKIAMFLSGCGNISDLSEVPLNISGKTREWFNSRDLDPDSFEG